MSEGRQKQKKQKTPEKADDMLFDLYRSYGSFFDQNLWPQENARWHELLFCLATTVAGPEVPSEGVRDTIRLLDRMDLVSLDVLGSFLGDEESRNASSPILITIETLLQRSGFTHEEAKRTVTCFCEAAQQFQSRYEGKVQLLFRKYGRMMMEELTRDFAFSECSKDDANEAYATWLQNTLNMPLPMSSHVINATCEEIGLPYNALVEAADRSDINVALLDNMLLAYMRDQMAQAQGRSDDG